MATPKATPYRVEKPWGYELVWAHTDRYVGKVLHVKKGESLSLQYHRVKDETMHVFSGEVRLQIDEGGELKERVVSKGESIRIPPNTRHRVEALTDADLLEASTPELDDVVRLEDRYGRVK
jgi:quercetin dioxygenase-like cupin family protein